MGRIEITVDGKQLKDVDKTRENKRKAKVARDAMAVIIWNLRKFNLKDGKQGADMAVERIGEDLKNIPKAPG